MDTAHRGWSQTGDPRASTEQFREVPITYRALAPTGVFADAAGKVVGRLQLT
jgi:hypothetical protein